MRRTMHWCRSTSRPQPLAGAIEGGGMSLLWIAGGLVAATVGLLGWCLLRSAAMADQAAERR